MSTQARELSSRMRRIGLGVIGLAAVAGLVTVSILSVNLITSKAVDVPTALIIAAIAVLVAGQIWVILALRVVLGAGHLRRWNLGPATAVLARINPIVLGVLVAIAFGGWLSTVSAALGDVSGSPILAASTCAHTLNNHGTYMCLTEAEYQHHRAELQRLVAGVLTGFFSLHVAGGLIARGRATEPLLPQGMVPQPMPPSELDA